MLRSLYIKNLAVIEEAFIEFREDLNIFTGETGAGKSIVIDAINAVLGQRTSKEVVRTGTPKATISATFEEISGEVRKKLDEFGVDCEESELIIGREITVDGRSSARINGIPITLNILKEIGSMLINIHGQHDNQVLLSSEKHINILDSYADMKPLTESYKSSYKELCETSKKLKEINIDESEKNYKIELLTYQIKEIEDVDLTVGEEEQLRAELKLLRNGEEIAKELQSAYGNLYGDEDIDGAVTLVSIASTSLENACEYYEELNDVSSRIMDISEELNEIANDVRHYTESIEFDPFRVDFIEQRLDEIFKLKRKYGQSIDEILSFLDRAKSELESIEMSDELKEKLTKDYDKYHTETCEKANMLTKERQQAAERFISAVSEELQFLDMKSVRVEVDFAECELGVSGVDKIEFLISTNVGEPPKPISKIASGGELSRIMLAIKNSLAEKDSIPTLIFDEIDTGVSGQAAQKIGLKLRQAAQSRQIICVTHSAQIAALAGTHLYISKSSKDDRTYTKVDILDFDGRKHELARIMGTDTQTELMLQNAEEMLKMAGRIAD